MFDSLLAFVGGALVGALLLLLWLKLRPWTNVDLPPPVVNGVNCQTGRIEGTIGAASAPGGMDVSLVELHTLVYDDPATDPPASPPSGTTTHAPASDFSLPHTLPSGSSNHDLAVVWAVYRVCVHEAFPYPACSGSGSGFAVGISPPSAQAAQQLEAIPRAYRVSVDPRPEGSGPAADLVSALALAPPTILEYVPEASHPSAPLWRARSKPASVREWTLSLLHQKDGFGAVVSVVCLIGGKEILHTWATNAWRFDALNRLTCNAEEVSGLSMVVVPA